MSARISPTGERLNISVRYDNWPTALDESGSADYYEPQDDGDSRIVAMISLVIVMVMVFCIVYAITRASDGVPGRLLRAAVCVRQQPVVPSGAGRPPEARSVGMKRRPAPPPSHRSGGFGGGSRGGGFGGGGFGGGGGHCAAPAAAPVPCACACAGGGRAGCSAKNLYGAIHLDDSLTKKVEE